MTGADLKINLRDPLQAEGFVRKAMAGQPERLAHVFVVAQKVRESAEAILARRPVMEIDPEFACAAAWLHDIGYASCAKASGFHPHDGYVYLKRLGYGDLAEVVGGHSCSPEEAAISGYAALEPSDALAAKLITYWDMQVAQGGEVVSYAARLADILARYGPKSPIGRANLAAKPRIELIIREIKGLLAAMIESTIAEAAGLARAWQAEGKTWHFHMLTPNCFFNERKDKQAFILENRSEDNTYVVYSDERYVTEGRELVCLLHGADIVSENPAGCGEPCPAVQEMLSRAESLNARQVHWHHHMLFPDCIFNKRAGLWNLVFEDPETGALWESTSEREPRQSLRAIEVLYYAQKSR
jgi:hypothetical protein